MGAPSAEHAVARIIRCSSATVTKTNAGRTGCTGASKTYRVPKSLVGRPRPDGPIPSKIFPVFRDRDELASSPDLPAILRAALAQSAHIIVLCSPAAARSRWVNQEIIEFKRLGRADRILPLIVDGEPHSSAPGRECFPPALRFQIDAAGRLTAQPAEPDSD